MRSQELRFSVAALALLLWTALSGGAATYEDVTGIAAELGITPESLAVAGLGEESAAKGVLLQLQSADDLREQFLKVRAEAEKAAALVSELDEVVSLHPENPKLLAEYASATASWSQISSQLAALRDALLETVLLGIPAEADKRLAAWRASTGFTVPAEFRVVFRTHEQWQAIEAALRAEQRANRLGTLLGAQHAKLLWEVRSETDVIDAEFLLEAHHGTAQSVFALYAGE